MDIIRKLCRVGTLWTTVALMALVHNGECQPDTTPPNVTCDDVITAPFLPNSFYPSSDQYTYEDENPDNSGISYNVTTGDTGYLFPPGRTPVTLLAVDAFDNLATCVFYVENQLTELPVNCPNLNRTETTDARKSTYTYIPPFEASEVTKSILGYRYHGAVYVDTVIMVDSGLDVGTHPETVMISDEVLSLECTGYFIVEDTERPNVTCPADITENSTNVIQFSADVFDNVGANLTYSVEPGSRFDLGVTTVSVTALDQAGLNDTCSLMVQLSISELPVQCPSDESVQLDAAEFSYQYQPMTESNLTLISPTYQFYGDVTITVLVNGTDNYTLPIGTYAISTFLEDTGLNKTCSSVLTVETTSPVPTGDNPTEKTSPGPTDEHRTDIEYTSPESTNDPGEPLPRVAIITIGTCGAVLLIVVVVCCVLYVKKQKQKINTRPKQIDTKKGGGNKTKTSGV